MTESDEEETLNLLKRNCKMPMETKSSRRRRTTTIPEVIMVEILARLPLISIVRFKSVCQTWKSVIESAHFRRLFISLHRDSSSSWSLMFRTAYSYSITEVMGLHGCETWYLPKSPGSYIFPFQPYPDPNPNRYRSIEYSYLGSSNGLIWIEASIRGTASKSFVGNPVLQEWVEIPPPPEPFLATGLVTRVDEDGLVTSFKVVRTCRDSEWGMCEWRVYVYSSETGLWNFKRLLSSHPIHYVVSFYPPMNINGMLYLWVRSLSGYEPGVLIAHDFYGHEASDQCRIIPLPLPYNRDVKRCLTPSGGDAIYIEILDRRLKVWRLNNNNNNNSESSECWQLLREEINMASVGFDVHCIPMALNPFDSDILYLYSLQHFCFVSFNLQTKEFVVHEEEFVVHKESENWSSSKGCGRINTHRARGYMEHAQYLYSVVMLSQFVLPRRMDPVPRPPN